MLKQQCKTQVSEIQKLAQFLETLTCGETIAKRVRQDMLADPDTRKLLKPQHGVRTPLCPVPTSTPSPQRMLRLVGSEDAPQQ